MKYTVCKVQGSDAMHTNFFFPTTLQNFSEMLKNCSATNCPKNLNQF